jgi:hypothetical protein
MTGQTKPQRVGRQLEILALRSFELADRVEMANCN